MEVKTRMPVKTLEIFTHYTCTCGDGVGTEDQRRVAWENCSAVLNDRKSDSSHFCHTKSISLNSI